MIQKVSLWHLTPVDLGIEFYDPTTSALETGQALYDLVNDPDRRPDRSRYSKSDYRAIRKMKDFLGDVRQRIEGTGITVSRVWPGIDGCIAKFRIHEQMACYVLVSGIAVFFEIGDPIDYADENYFSLEVFHQRQVYEDDYCVNSEETDRKKPLYDFLRLMWKCVGRKEFSYSASDDYCNHGISYTLCITMVHIPGLVSNQVDEQLRRNFRAILDTSAFSNILSREQWPAIRQRIDSDDCSDLQLRELSETLVFADNWSGVLVAGDLEKNRTCITWLMEFEIFLQANWFLFDAYCQNIVRQDLSAVELQGILNRVEMIKVKLDNDISSNMEQSRHIMRNSLIASSDIGTIYSKMHGLVTSKMKLKVMDNDHKKSRFALFSDLSLLIIALLEVYAVVNDLLYKETFTRQDLITTVIMLGVAAVCVFIMVRGHD